LNSIYLIYIFSFFFSFISPAPPAIHTLSLHDALPICPERRPADGNEFGEVNQRADVAARHAEPEQHRDHHDRQPAEYSMAGGHIDRKSTRLNSSHGSISYAVFCLKKKTKKTNSNKT